MAPINRNQLGIILLRSMFALMWLSQAAAKLLRRSSINYKDFNNFLFQLRDMAQSQPLAPVAALLNNILLPNWRILVIVVISTEIFIGLSLGLGLMTRLGSIVGAIMSLSLWVLTLGWGEWFWTYPLIFFPHILFALSDSNYVFGLDKVVAKHLPTKLQFLLSGFPASV